MIIIVIDNFHVVDFFGRNLVDRDKFSKSDPVCVVYSKNMYTNEYIEEGRTEQVKNNLNPEWRTKFTVEYHFEERQVCYIGPTFYKIYRQTTLCNL